MDYKVQLFSLEKVVLTIPSFQRRVSHVYLLIQIRIFLAMVYLSSTPLPLLLLPPQLPHFLVVVGQGGVLADCLVDIVAYLTRLEIGVILLLILTLSLLLIVILCLHNKNST